MNGKTIGLLILVLVLLGATGLIASRLLLSQAPSDSTISTSKTNATFQKEVNITIPTPTSTILAQAIVSPTAGPVAETTPSITPTGTSQVPTSTPTSAITPSPTETILAFQGSVTSTVTASPTAMTTSQSLPSAGSYQYPLLILLAASVIVIVSIIY